VVAELRAEESAEPRAEESAEQKFAREAGARIMQAIALSEFATELHAAGAAAGLHSAEGAVNDSARAGAPVPNEDLTT